MLRPAPLAITVTISKNRIGSCNDSFTSLPQKGRCPVTSQLIAHAGARVVSLEELESVEAPPSTDTWFPIRHSQVLHSAIETLGEAGFVVHRNELALSRGNSRFFGVLDLVAPIANGVNLAVGIRNSVDKSLPISFCAGTRVFVCDNLAFRSEIVVARKHTKYGALRFQEALAKAVGTLPQFREKEQERVLRFQNAMITSELAEAMMLRSFEQGIVSHRMLPDVIQEWRKPSHEEFAPRTLWSLEQCFTGILASVQKSNPQRFASLTIRLQDLLLQAESPHPLQELTVTTPV